MLQRACADIVLIENGCSKKVYILFDSGAQPSYITRVTKKLEFKTTRVERIVLMFLVRKVGKL